MRQRLFTLIVLLEILCYCCCMAQDEEVRVVRGGNTFELAAGYREKISLHHFIHTVEDSPFILLKPPHLYSVNGDAPTLLPARILRGSTEADGGYRMWVRGTKELLLDYVTEQLAPLLNKLEDGNYFLPIVNVVADDSGRIIFYETAKIKKIASEHIYQDSLQDSVYYDNSHKRFVSSSDEDSLVSYSLSGKGIPPLLRRKIDRKIKKVLSEVRLNPSNSPDRPGDALTGYVVFHVYYFENRLSVRDHHVSVWFPLSWMLEKIRPEAM